MRTTIGAMAALLAAAPLAAQDARPDDRATAPVLIGELAPRDAADTAANHWSIGVETIDRDFSRYAAFRDYVGPLGAKHARLQSGWARTDRGNGRYDFAWLDPIVDDLNAQKVQPWFTLGYGNPAYPGGGTAQRDSDLPRGAGRAAWLAYVRAIVTRYRDKVDYWELWNEPELIGRFTAAEYGAFAAETALLVRSIDADATISIAGFSGLNSGKGDPFIREAVRVFVDRAGRGTAQVVGVHTYSARPEALNRSLDALLRDVRAIDPGLSLRQGEAGAPSINQPLFALADTWWTEEAQAKWVLRRMLNDASRGMWTSVFTIVDLHYSLTAEQTATFNEGATRRGAAVALNSKGLLETRRYDPTGKADDKRVVRAKMAYRAMQGVTSIFDAALAPVPGACTTATAGISVATFRRADGKLAIAAWRDADRPGERPEHQAIDIRCTQGSFADAPLYVDLLTAGVYRADRMAQVAGGTLLLRAVPIYDAPVVIADPALVPTW